ncbi:Paraquat-inducible protein A [Pelomyxa schiedti]|nr:Paraquat-inducible protein A [Pelomyxa schiedti]
MQAKIQSCFCLFVFCLVSLLCVSSARSGEAHTTDDGPCDLRCWLADFSITVPDQQLYFNYTFVTFHEVWCNITNITCHGISLEEVSSSVDLERNSVELGVFGLGTSCFAAFSAINKHGRTVDYGAGTLVATVTNSSVDVEITLQQDDVGLATAANVTKCFSDIVISELNFTGGNFAEQMDEILMKNNTIPALEKALEVVICDLLHVLVNDNLTEVLTYLNSVIYPYILPQPPHAIPLLKPGAFNLSESALVNMLDYMFNEFIGINGTLGLNDLINVITNGTGSFFFDDLDIMIPIEIPGLGRLDLGILDLSIGGLNTWKTFQLLIPHELYTLVSETNLGVISLNATFSVNVSVASDVIHDSHWLYEEARFTLKLEENVLDNTFQVTVYPQRSENYTNTMCMDPQCLLGIFGANSTAITELLFNITIAQLGLVASAGDLEDDVDQAIDDVLLLLTTSFEQCVPAFLNGFVAGPVVVMLNDLMSTGLNEAECEYQEDVPYKLDRPNPYATYSSIIGSFLVFFIVTGICICIQRYRKKAKKEADSPYSEMSPLKTEQEQHPCLILHPKIPAWMRYLMPLLICLNMMIFVSSNTSGGASVYLALITGLGRSVNFPPMFAFTLANSVHDMWLAGVWPLSLLICIFSGAWPYLKLVLMFAAWVAPVKIVSVKSREYLLMFLDAFGKWSMLDSYVMVMMLVAFHMIIEFPPYEPAGNTDPFQIVVFVDPLYGFLTLMLGTMFSLILSHILVALHRYAESPSKKQADEASSNLEALCVHVMHTKTTFVRVLFNLMVVFGLIFTLAVLVLGLITPSFSFSFKGAAGWLLDVLQPYSSPSEATYSVISIAFKVPGATAEPNSFTVRTVQAVFLLTAICLPVIHLIALLVLWLIPMSRRTQRHWYTFCEVLNAWASLDVFVVSILAALLEIEQLALFIVADYCVGVDVLLAKYMDPLLGGYDTCFDVIATLEQGCWMLFGAAVVYDIVTFIVMKSAHKALGERGSQKIPLN